MYQKLSDIAIVISGYTFRKAVQPDLFGGVHLVQPNNIRMGIPIDSLGGLEKIEDNLVGYKGYIVKGDVVLVTKGSKLGPFRSTVCNLNGHVNSVIASSSVFVIRISKPEILPEFLSLYLNSDVGQSALLRIVSGESIGSLPKRLLEQIEIPVPPLSNQKVHVNLWKNINQQIEIIKQQISLKESLINASFQELSAN